MTQSKHSPGPWNRDKYGSIIDSSGCDVVFRGVTTLRSGNDDRMAIAEANSDLATSAPELLEALQAAVDCGMVPTTSATEGGAAKFSRQVVVADMIRAAIAKATGGAA